MLNILQCIRQSQAQHFPSQNANIAAIEKPWAKGYRYSRLGPCQLWITRGSWHCKLILQSTKLHNEVGTGYYGNAEKDATNFAWGWKKFWNKVPLEVSLKRWVMLASAAPVLKLEWCSARTTRRLVKCSIFFYLILDRVKCIRSHRTLMLYFKKAIWKEKKKMSQGLPRWERWVEGECWKCGLCGTGGQFGIVGT